MLAKTLYFSKGEGKHIFLFLTAIYLRYEMRLYLGNNGDHEDDNCIIQGESDKVK